MTTKTNFNTAPYFDDYDSDKGFHRVLFKPKTPVQARELTQLQTILQNQVEKFGENILREGTIVKGGNFVEERGISFVKLRDSGVSNETNQSVSVRPQDLEGMKVVGLSTSIEGIIATGISGFESQSPNLNTIYVNYITNAQDTNDNNIGQFSPTEEIQVQRLNENNAWENYMRITAAGAVEANSVGKGYGVRCGDGVIFQKGFFIGFSDSLTIVSKYSTEPNEVVVGFETKEIIVTSNQDQSLLDNANGFESFNAPGADRLKLDARLVVRSLEESIEDEDFFAVQEYSFGKVVRRNLLTQFNSISQTLEQRTAEESGNYAVRNFSVRVEENINDATNLSVKVGSGLAYVEGKRVETLGDISIPLSKADDFDSSENQDVVANYGHYVICNNVKGDFGFSTFSSVDLLRGTTKYGTARVRSVTKDGVSGNIRLYIADIKLNSGRSFSNINKVSDPVNGGTADLILENGKATIKDFRFKRSIFPIGQSHIRSIDSSRTDYITRVKEDKTVSPTGQFTISLGTNRSFPYTPNNPLNSDQLRDIIVVSKQTVNSYNQNDHIEIISATVDSSAKSMTVNIAAPNGDMPVSVYYNAKIGSVNTNRKVLKTVWVRFEGIQKEINEGFSTGFPDVYSLEEVHQYTPEDWDEFVPSNDSLVTNQFTLDNGQNDIYYGLGRLNNSVPLPASNGYLAKLKVFEKDVGDNAFFTVDSYPVDDVSIELPEGNIRTQDIPQYVTESGLTIFLRDSIDLRPYATATASYAQAYGEASINPSSNINFTNLVFPAPNKTIETSYTYYMSRKDILVINKFGDFELISGTPSVIPSDPSIPSKGMVIAKISIPPFPSLPSNVANRIGKPQYGVAVSEQKNRRYTMKDIGNIDKRIDSLEYYTALSLLEKSASDMAITDENGNDRFKNGIFVDNFKDLSLADVKNGEFSAGIDPSEKVIHPRFRAYPLSLRVTGTQNLVEYDQAYAIQNTSVRSVHQPYATSSRSCTTDLYKFNGNVTLIPEYDISPDFTRAPDVNLNIDLASQFSEFTELLSEFVPLQVPVTEKISSTTKHLSETHRVTTRKFQDRIDEFTVGNGSVFNEQVGDFVTDVSFRPFMRSREISVYVNGMRPNTRYYFFFDGQSVDQHMANARVVSGKIVRTSKFGDVSIKSNANGEISAVFKLPAETFFVGDRMMEIADVKQYSAIDTSSSYASKRYSAFNFAIEKTGINTSTRIPEFAVQQNVVGTRTTVTFWDPIAQTFVIDPSLSQDSSVMLTKADIYFYSKSRTNGVTVEIREVENGYPSPKVVPFSRTHLSASDVIASDQSANLPTTVFFEAPIALKTNVEYALVVRPDANDPAYRVWISKTGLEDIDTGKQVTNDSNAGVLFTSTNNRAWTAYQDENMKFTLHQARFSHSSGNITYTTNNTEFFSLENNIGEFENDEFVFVKKENGFKSGTVTFAAGQRTVNGNGTSFTSEYNEGEYFVARGGNGTYQVLLIENIADDNTLTVSNIITENGNTVAEHYSSPVGRAVHYVKNKPSILILEDSSAKDGMLFQNGDKIAGALSEAVADVTEVMDMPLSYFQTNIFRTNFDKTRTRIEASRLTTIDGQTYSKTIDFSASNKLVDKNTIIKSKSNSLNDSGFELKVYLENTETGNRRDTSPFIDKSLSGMTGYYYMINNDNSGEVGRFGNALSKYVSRKIELGDDLPAEDFRLLLTAYRPSQTEIEAYVKFQSVSDDRRSEDVAWTKLFKKEETSTFSNLSNPNDYSEFEFFIPSTARQDGMGAWIDNSQGFIYKNESGQEFLDYKFFTIKLVMLSQEHNRPVKIKDMRGIAIT